MSGENVEVVRSLLGPFQRINVAEIDWGAEPICQLPAGSFSPEIEVRTLESGMGTGVDPVYNGVDGVVRYLQDWLEPFTDYRTEWLDDLRQRQLTRRPERTQPLANVSGMNQDAVARPWQGFLWLSRRECHRVLRLWTQTTLAPVVSSLLFIVVFGLSLGGRIKQVDGFDYDQFIVPGLIAMAMAQAAYSNNASTIFQGRSDRYIDDVLAAPMHNWQVNLGYLVGGAFRALIIGVGLAACAIPITGAPVIHPALLIVGVLLLVVGFGALGTIVGIYAETFDHTSFINNIVILPLTFLGGVFYSVSRLGSPWEQLSHVNPLFYVVETIRYGFLGVSDVSPWIAFAVVAGMCLALLAWSQWLFTSGRKLKP